MVKEGHKTQKVLTHGVLSRDGPEKVLSHWMGYKDRQYLDQLGLDEAALELMDLQGNYLTSDEEFSCGKRYKRAVKDIINRHLLGEQPGSEKTVLLVSHSSGIKPILKMFGKEEWAFKKGCYCCMISAELERESEDKYKLLDLKILRQ